MKRFSAYLFLLFVSSVGLCVDKPLKDDGVVSLFNGVDLKGWGG